MVGVDPSEVMCAVARRHNRRAIAAGQVRVACGDSEHIPAADASFDKVFSTHTLYFWPDLSRGLAELRRVLRPGGALWLAFHSAENRALATKLPATVYTLRSRPEVEAALGDVGFEEAGVREDPATGVALVHARA